MTFTNALMFCYTESQPSDLETITFLMTHTLKMLTWIWKTSLENVSFRTQKETNFEELPTFVEYLPS